MIHLNLSLRNVRLALRRLPLVFFEKLFASFSENRIRIPSRRPRRWWRWWMVQAAMNAAHIRAHWAKCCIMILSSILMWSKIQHRNSIEPSFFLFIDCIHSHQDLPCKFFSSRHFIFHSSAKSGVLLCKFHLFSYFINIWSLTLGMEIRTELNK